MTARTAKHWLAPPPLPEGHWVSGLAYTDGATEAADEGGRMLGIRGMQGILAAGATQSEGAWPVALLTEVDAHRDGPPKDDTLVIEIYRTVSSASSRRAPARDTNDESRVPVG